MAVKTKKRRSKMNKKEKNNIINHVESLLVWDELSKSGADVKQVVDTLVKQNKIFNGKVVKTNKDDFNSYSELNKLNRRKFAKEKLNNLV
jgi:hypothetical protein